jgi:ABC-type uncharacterized transport system permease subunit
MHAGCRSWPYRLGRASPTAARSTPRDSRSRVLRACAASLLAAAQAGLAGALVLVIALVRLTAIGWNGVQISELARRAPPGSSGLDHRRRPASSPSAGS